MLRCKRRRALLCLPLGLPLIVGTNSFLFKHLVSVSVICACTLCTLSVAIKGYLFSSLRLKELMANLQVPVGALQRANVLLLRASPLPSKMSHRGSLLSCLRLRRMANLQNPIGALQISDVSLPQAYPLSLANSTWEVTNSQR